jgi:hypothetical protein
MCTTTLQGNMLYCLFILFSPYPPPLVEHQLEKDGASKGGGMDKCYSTYQNVPKRKEQLAVKLANNKSDIEQRCVTIVIAVERANWAAETMHVFSERR